MKAKIFVGLGSVFSCGILIAALSAADTTPAPAAPAPNYSFVESDDPAVADIAKFGSDAIQNIGGQLVSEVSRELATKETSVAVSVLHLKNLEIPKSKPGQPTITAVRRTSLLVRNHLNAPDAADQAALEKIQDQLDNGDHVSKLLVQRVDHPNAPVEWRVYRPIAATQACLACHGDPATFRPGVKEALDRLYPDDKATGYKEQTWRGFIRVSLTAALPAPAPAK
jgi:hypothetical protein